MALRVGIVAGETSGDILGSGLIAALSARRPDAEFSGIAGPRMQAVGCRSVYPIERLSVMGLVEAIGRYRELLPMRARLARHFIEERPDVVVGVDAPDFNLGLERRLRAAGIPTVHYASPAVWAWRRYRLRKIARSVDLMLTLFPFEAEFYRSHRVPVEFVGHPLADEIPGRTSRSAARGALGLDGTREIVALLPGSRASEVGRLLGPMLETARWLAERRPGIGFVIPVASEATREMVESGVSGSGSGLSVSVLDARSRECMAAADVVLLASGTATLEAMLLGRPMVVTYRAAPLTYGIMKGWIGRNVRFAALPNLLADRLLVPELMQAHASARWLGPAVDAVLASPERFAEVRRTFAALHRQLRRGASARAAEAVLRLIAGRTGSRDASCP